MELAQYRELAAFAQFGSELDKATLAQLERGQRLMELLKQPQYRPIELDAEVIGIYAVTNGFADDVPVNKIRDFEEGLLQFMSTTHPEVGRSIMDKKALTDEIKTALDEAIKTYMHTVSF
jgi:F-type H+-transporting ATPase subunit alpha